MIKYCPDVFKSIYLEKIDNKKTGVGFCCQNQISIVDNSLIHQTLNEKREKFLSNFQDSQCKICWDIENQGGLSRRNASLQWFQNNKIKLNKEISIVSLDWNSENICNLACITCGPRFSSRWTSEIQKYSWNQQDQLNSQTIHNQSYENLDFTTLQKVYFNGGEPLLSSDHITIMKLLQDNGQLDQCEISYNTNCTTLPTSECLRLWKQARLVRLMLSIDAVDAAFEFIRWPAKWQQVIEFVDFIKSLDINVQIDITCTIGIHNIFSLPKLIQWHENSCSHNHQGDKVSLNFQSCAPLSYGGKVLNINNVSEKMSQSVERFIRNNISRNEIISLFDFKPHNDRSDVLWENYLGEISKVRNVSWQQSLPDLYNKFNNLIS